MSELKSEFPFKPGGKIVGQSVNSDIFDKGSSVVKIRKKHAPRNFETLEETFRAIKTEKGFMDNFNSELQSFDVNHQLVPKEDYIIHDAAENKFTFSRSQKHFQNSKPMSELNIAVFSIQNLVDLKNILKSDISIWKKTGKFSDLLGSSANPDPFFKKLTRNIFPILSSQNIVLTDKGDVKVIDTGLITRKDRFPITALVKDIIRLTGDYISLGIVNFNIEIKKLASHQEFRDSTS